MRRLLIALRTQCCSDAQIENDEMCGHVVSMGEKRGIYRVLVGKNGGKTQA
jgi:hypothetical protein